MDPQILRGKNDRIRISEVLSCLGPSTRRSNRYSRAKAARALTGLPDGTLGASPGN